MISRDVAISTSSGQERNMLALGNYPPPVEAKVIISDTRVVIVKTSTGEERRLCVSERAPEPEPEPEVCKATYKPVFDLEADAQCRRRTLCGLITFGSGVGSALGAGLGAIGGAAVMGAAVGTTVGAGGMLAVAYCVPRALDAATQAAVRAVGQCLSCTKPTPKPETETEFKMVVCE